MHDTDDIDVLVAWVQATYCKYRKLRSPDHDTSNNIFSGHDNIIPSIAQYLVAVCDVKVPANATNLFRNINNKIIVNLSSDYVHSRQ